MKVVADTLRVARPTSWSNSDVPIARDEGHMPARERLVAERTALINQMRALLLERGIVPPQHRRAVASWVDAPREAGAPDCLSPRIRLLVTDMRAEWTELDRRIAAFDEEFAASARQDEAARRLATVPGIGPINATALVAAVGDASTFGRARDLAAWLGLVPKQAMTGGKPKLLGILTAMAELKLYGMKAAFDEIIGTAVKRQHEPARIVGDLLTAEISEKQARRVRYQIAIAKLDTSLNPGSRSILTAQMPGGGGGGGGGDAV